MRILVLTKRSYTGKDLLTDRYGRLFELPAWLARFGHQVTGLALSYRGDPNGEHCWEDLPGLIWYSENIGIVPFLSYVHTIRHLIKVMQPELIWACSDAFHAILGIELQRKFAIPVVIDLYDNFESFPASRFPGVVPLLRSACRKAAGVTVVGRQLDQYVQAQYGLTNQRLVLTNGIDPLLFTPQDRVHARQKLGIPVHGRLIGTAGALTAGRGIATLYDAFFSLANENPDLYLVLAGPRDSTPGRYIHERIIDLGILGLEEIPWLLSSLDIGVVCNLDSEFGRYCFPQKLYEMVACGSSILAAQVGEAAELLAEYPHSLFAPGDSHSLAWRIRAHLLNSDMKANLQPISWEQLAINLEGYFLTILASQ